MYDRTTHILVSHNSSKEINNQIPHSITWINLFLETKESNVKIVYVFDQHKFQRNNKWYDHYNKSVISNNWIHIDDAFIIKL